MKHIFISSLLFIGFITTSFARDITTIKLEILEMAESFKGQTDEDGSKQEALEILIDELMTFVPNMSMEEKAMRALGTWNQVWGPYAFDDSNTVPGGLNVDKIYQYISGDGYYYNFSEKKFAGINVKYFLRGEYEIAEDRINVKFTKTGLILKRGEVNYASAGEAIENKDLRVFNFPASLPPVGVSGALIEVYADEEMRINYGVVGGDIDNPALFILKRAK